jgi:hypothetical protein
MANGVARGLDSPGFPYMVTRSRPRLVAVVADKGAKKKAKRNRAQPSVLASLPHERPQRLGGSRPARRTVAADAQPAPPPPAQQTPPPAARPSRPARAAAAKKAPAAPRPQSRPAPSPPPPPPPRRRRPPRGTELVTTTIQAAGELAQIGLTVGGQVLKRAVDRIPRP